MAVSEIPVDLANPGQVFACLGFMEAAEILIGGAMATFAWSGAETSAHFRLEADGVEAPVPHVLRFLVEAEVVSLAPAGSGLSTIEKKSGGVQTVQVARGEPFPMSIVDRDGSAIGAGSLPVRMSASGNEIDVAHWRDSQRRTGLEPLKLWSPTYGISAASTMRECLSRLPEERSKNPFDHSAYMRPAFRLDHRSGYTPLSAGFSPNKHANGAFLFVGFPVVEAIAAVGLTYARPKRIASARPPAYEYGVLGASEVIDPTILRASMGGTQCLADAALRRFRFQLARIGDSWPEDQKQAQTIVDVTELPDQNIQDTP